MPPRYAYWTILIDGKATAFRAHEREELQPTLTQLQRTNTDVTLKFFARGKLWDSPEQAQWASKSVPPKRERRNADWRPGGTHEDPRARFDKKARERRERNAKAPARAKGAWSPVETEDDTTPIDPAPTNEGGTLVKQPRRKPVVLDEAPPARSQPAAPVHRERPQFTPKFDHGNRKGFSDRKPSFGDRKPASGDRRPAPGDRKSVFADWKPPSGDRKPSSRDAKPEFRDRKPAFGNRKPPAGDRKPVFADWKPPSGDRKPGFDRKPAFGDRKPAFGDRRPPTGDRQRAFSDRKPEFRDRKPGVSDRRPPAGNRPPSGDRPRSGDQTKRFSNDRARDDRRTENRGGDRGPRGDNQWKDRPAGRGDSRRPDQRRFDKPRKPR